MFAKKTYRNRWVELLISLSTDEEGGVINERGDTATLHYFPERYPCFILATRPHPSIRELMVREWQQVEYIAMSHKDDSIGCRWDDGWAWVSPRNADQLDCPFLPDQHLRVDSLIIYERWTLDLPAF